MSGLKTLLFTGATVATAAMAISSGFGIGGLLWGAAAVFMGMKAWGSHKESAMEDNSAAMAYRMSQERSDAAARSHQIYVENGAARDGWASGYTQHVRGQSGGRG